MVAQSSSAVSDRSMTKRRCPRSSSTAIASESSDADAMSISPETTRTTPLEKGSTITVKYAGGEKQIIVPETAPIVRYEIGGKADLKPGAHFTVLAATKRPDGTFETSRINVGRDGAVPQ